jgi:hypothetical protein
MNNSMVWNNCSKVNVSHEEKLFSLLTIEIDFLNRCEEKAENIYQKYIIQNALFKLENLLNILLESPVSIDKHDYHNMVCFVYRTIEILIKCIFH